MYTLEMYIDDRDRTSFVVFTLSYSFLFSHNLSLIEPGNKLDNEILSSAS